MALLSGGQVVSHSPNDYGERLNVLGATISPALDRLNLLESSATYAEIYKRQLWVSTLVNKISMAQARLPFKSYSRTSKGRTDERDSAFGRLMQRPMPGHGKFFFHLWTGATLETHGEAVWIKVRDPLTKLPIALWPMHPANLDIRRRPDGRGHDYVWRLSAGTAKQVSWPDTDVVHFKTFNPDTILRGMSRLEPLRRTLLSEDAVQSAQESFWRHGARPGVLLKHPGTLKPDAGKRLKAQWDELQSGTKNWGKTAILEEGMEAQVIQLSASEMQMIDSRKLSREEACSLYDVPPPVVHILDRATFSNVTEQMRSMYRDTMAPRLGLYESVILESLAAEFGDNIYGRYAMDEVLRGSLETRYQAYATGINYGFLKPGEARAMEEWEDAGATSDQLFISSAMIPLEAAAQSQPARTGRPATEVRSLMGRLSRTLSPADVDVHALTVGLDPAPADAVFAAVTGIQAGGGDMKDLRAAVAAALTGEDER